MRLAVLLKTVPDLVEELALDEDARTLLFDEMSYVPSEWDDQALEEALIIKEESGAEVTVIAVDTGDVDTMLFTALAKGADYAVKIVGDFDAAMSNWQKARVVADYLGRGDFDAVLSGVQAIDDVDGQLPGLVAGFLGWPHASVITEVRVAGGSHLQLRQEYAGGLVAELETVTPIVVGVQAARKPPRYASVAKVRQVAKSATIDEVEADVAEARLAGVEYVRPVAAGHAEMIEGDIDEVVDRIVAILEERNLLRRA
ncbi:MAG: electron transfer flavoprotein subunit beta [Sulfobacillus thermotolerans]|uniref:Electron transfer flavoprotein subunit beta n=1 Tax=Sulfobacillus thermotolerans TaxID=338644 RepID=A0ABM6RQG7_9FIRM|nr:electron transfer flavoprotein subunit beta [Sulfobacillus thermotolerans]MCY0907064.1 electron transfer flavoprotein subunit beta [Sulfobacillus thermotolerans]